MKKVFALILIIMIIPIILTAASDDVILNAMRDEMKRSISELKMESLEKPYFIEYTYTINSSNHISAVLGNINSSTSSKNANITVNVQVGSYKFDNTNFSGSGLFFFGGGGQDDEERFSSRPVSYETDYQILRREFWLATDAAYKKSAEDFSKKQAVLKNRLRKDTTWDFIMVKPSKSNDLNKIEEYDKAKYEDILAAMSNTFRKYPEAFTSQTSLEYIPTKTYYVNSEGTEYVQSTSKVGIEVSSSSQADDGMIITEFYSCYANHLSELPSKDSLVRAAENVPRMLTAVRNAPVLEDTYAGPVIFSGQAAAEIFAQIFAPNLTTRREQLSSSGFPSNDRFAAFQRKIGGRVLPEFMSVEGSPSKMKQGNTPLFGHLKIDEEGILAQDITLVKDGYLKTLFSSRVPTQRIRESNGHKRGGAASISNIFVTSNDKKKTRSYEDMKKEMMKLCKDRELEYGLVIKRIMNPNIFSSAIVEQIFSGDFSYMRGNAINLTEVYKVYPDGREELVRGSEGAGFTAQSFKDIIYCGNQSTTYNFWGSASGYGNWSGMSVVIPDLFFEDAEIRSIDSDFKNPPILASPLAK